jgi:hypothetical protein
MLNHLMSGYSGCIKAYSPGMIYCPAIDNAPRRFSIPSLRNYNKTVNLS